MTECLQLLSCMFSEVITCMNMCDNFSPPLFSQSFLLQLAFTLCVSQSHHVLLFCSACSQVIFFSIIAVKPFRCIPCGCMLRAKTAARFD